MPTPGPGSPPWLPPDDEPDGDPDGPQPPSGTGRGGLSAGSDTDPPRRQRAAGAGTTLVSAFEEQGQGTEEQACRAAPTQNDEAPAAFAVGGVGSSGLRTGEVRLSPSLIRSLQLVAGAGFEPAAFRL
jgi:hypothetical protein